MPSTDQDGADSAAINTLFSFRTHWMCALAAVIASGVAAWGLGALGLDWLADRTLWFVGIPVWVLLLIASVRQAYTGHNPMYCHACGKRVKMNFTRCHHCGHDHAQRSTARPEASSPTTGLPAGEGGRTGVQAGPSKVPPPEPIQNQAVPQAQPQRPPGSDADPRLELEIPPAAAFQRVCEAADNLGKLAKADEPTGSLTVKVKYGLSTVRLHVTVSAGPLTGTSTVTIVARGQDIWGVAERKTTGRLLDAIRADNEKRPTQRPVHDSLSIDPGATMASAGWYPDVQRPGWMRYYDGEQWSEQWRPAEGADQPNAPIR